MTRLLIDRAIFDLQGIGGISSLWRALLPHLRAALSEYEIVDTAPADVFLSTYYQPSPDGMKSVVLCFDYIHTIYPHLSRFATESQWKYAAVEQADAVLAISQWTADDVMRYQGRTATVAYPATTLTRASHETVQAFRARYNLPERYVLIVGRRDLYKNVSSYWQALRLIDGPIATVCIGGEPLPAQANTYHLMLDESELAAAYTGAMCLVYPSLYEGFGLPVIEAYACGCAVICGSGGALAEINEAACVVNVTRPREIAQALVSLMNPGERIGYILKGYNVVKRFSWSSMAAAMAAVIRDVAERVEA